MKGFFVPLTQNSDLDDYYLYKKANKVYHMNEYFLNADDETIRDTRTSQGSDPKNAVTE